MRFYLSVRYDMSVFQYFTFYEPWKFLAQPSRAFFCFVLFLFL